MNFKSLFLPTLLVASSVAGVCAYAQSGNDSQNVTLNEKVQIPGASLKPGTYTFSVEDRLQDRAIVRITNQDQSKHYLVLTVPSTKLGQPGSDGLIRFTARNGKDQVLQGWACPGCTPELEFVYPKAEAAKLTDETAEPVLAVDPTYDKLPANLSPDDMKVVTLWLLSPERITASNKGKGVKAEKYASVAHPASTTQTASASNSELTQTPATPPPSQASQVTKPASNPPSTSSGTSELAQVPAPAPSSTPSVTAPTPAPAAQPTEMASAVPPASSDTGHHTGRLPKTASSDYLYLFGGMLLLMAALGVRLSRRFAFSR